MGRPRLYPNVEVGQRFGRWTAADVYPSEGGSGTKVLCRCDCGTERVVKEPDLSRGQTKSCGCGRLTHGGRSRPEYQNWMGMKTRCNNVADEHYPNYGGRGIRVCPEWEESFEAFLDHIGPRPSRRHTVDRIDNNRGYEPGNVRWATPEIQGRNRRNNRWITAGGDTKVLAEWAERLNVTRGLIRQRAKTRGLSYDEVVEGMLEEIGRAV